MVKVFKGLYSTDPLLMVLPGPAVPRRGEKVVVGRQRYEVHEVRWSQPPESEVLVEVFVEETAW